MSRRRDNREGAAGHVRRLCVACMVMALAGCARPAGVILEPGPDAPRWPAPPELARIVYLGSLESDRDLKPARRARRRIGEFLFGEEDANVMLSPVAVSAGKDSRVFVADSNGQMVHVFDLESRKYQRWRPGKDQARFSMPIGVVGTESGGVLVTDSVAGMIFVFDAKGVCTGTIGSGLLRRPCGIAIQGDRILVVDAAAHQLVALSWGGDEVARVGRRGAGLGEFNFPTNVAVDAAGRVYVSDTLNFRVQVLDADLKPMRSMGRKGDAPGYFSQPKGIALDPDGHLYVVDANFEAVQVFDPEGQLLLSFGGEGHGPGEFWLPSGISVDSRGRLWIADTYNRRVQVFQYLKEGAP